MARFFMDGKVYDTEKAEEVARFRRSFPSSLIQEYSGQKLAEVDGVRYRILRTYRDPKNTDITELTLSDLPEVQEDQGEEPDGGEQEGGGDGGTV